MSPPRRRSIRTPKKTPLKTPSNNNEAGEEGIIGKTFTNMNRKFDDEYIWVAHSQTPCTHCLPYHQWLFECVLWIKPRVVTTEFGKSFPSIVLSHRLLELDSPYRREFLAELSLHLTRHSTSQFRQQKSTTVLPKILSRLWFQGWMVLSLRMAKPPVERRTLCKVREA